MPQQSSTKTYQPQRKRPAQSFKQENTNNMFGQENAMPPVKKSAMRSTQPGQNRGGRPRNWIIAVAVLILIGVVSWYVLSSRLTSSTAPSEAIVANNNAQTATHSLLNSNVEATANAQATVNWQTIQTLSGHDTKNASQKTQTFKVPPKWQLNWACQGANGVDDSLYVAVYNTDGSLYDAGVQTTCLAAQKVVGNLVESKTGNATIYFSVSANTDWTITMRAPK